MQGSFLLTLVQQGVITDSFGEKKQFVGNQLSAIGNNNSFTLETGEPLLGIQIDQEGKSGWFSWTPATRSQVTVNTEGSLTDTLLAAYTGDSLATLKLVVKNDDISSTNRSSQITFSADAGQTYHFVAASKRGFGGYLKFNLSSTKLPPGIKLVSRRVVVYAGESATFSATTNVTGEPTYQWEIFGANKTWTALPENEVYSGVNTTSLTITGTDMSMNGTQFRLAASDVAGTSRSQAAVLTITEFPTLQTEVLGTVDFNLANGGVPAPTNNGGYFALGLPRGLTLNRETGVISGVVTAKPGTYLVSYGSTNGKIRNPEQYVLQIIVAPFSPHFTGFFEGLLNTVDEQALPHGKLTVKVAANGAYTGAYLVLAEGKNYPFRGIMDLDEENRTAGTPSATPLLISRGKSNSPLKLVLVLTEPVAESEDATIVSALIFDSTDTLLAQCADGPPVARFTATAPAPWAGDYTVRLTNTTLVNGASETKIPLGSGYATANITAKTGALAVRGRLADNTPVTANLPSSPSATYRMGQVAHGIGGSLAGRIRLEEQSGSDSTSSRYNADLSVANTLYWAKPPRVKDKLYPAGFGSGVVSLTALIEPWANPAGDIPDSLGLGSVGNIKVRITAVVPQDGNDSSTYNLPVDIRMNPIGALSFVSPSSNPTKFALKINSATGVYTGTYELAEAIVPPATKPVVRKVAFSGVLFQRSEVLEGDVIGEGFAIVPPLLIGEILSSAKIEFLAGSLDAPVDSGSNP